MPGAGLRLQHCLWSPSVIEIFQYVSHQVSGGEFYLRKTEYYESFAKLMDFVRGQGDGQIVGYEYPTFAYTKLKLFFLSVLWRAGASSQEFFKRVDLGPHFDTLRNRLLNADPGQPDEYAVVLAVFDDDPDWAKIMDPFPERYGETGIRFYRLYVGNFIAYVKVDQRPAESPMRDLQLTPDAPLRIVQRTFAESKERCVMRNVVVETERRNKVMNHKVRPRTASPAPVRASKQMTNKRNTGK